MLIASIVLLAGCDDQTTPRRGEPSPAAPGVGTSDRPGPDADRLEFERQMPGFAGFYFDTLGNMRVVLTDTTRIDLARVVLRAKSNQWPRGASIPPGRPIPAGEREIVAQQGKYSYSQLLTWKSHALRTDVGRGLVGIDVLISANKVEVGVADRADVDVVRARLVEAGIPSDALQISVHDGLPPAVTLK